MRRVEELINEEKGSDLVQILGPPGLGRRDGDGVSLRLLGARHEERDAARVHQVVITARIVII